MVELPIIFSPPSSLYVYSVMAHGMFCKAEEGGWGDFIKSWNLDESPGKVWLYP